MKKRRVVKHSKGELLCGEVLRSLPVDLVKGQFPLGPFFFDYLCSYQGRLYLIEYDGIQHFQYVKFIHRREINYRSRVKADANKTALALVHGYTVIRIDYTQDTAEAIQQHLLAGFRQDKRLYLSRPEFYGAILSSIIKPSIYQGLIVSPINPPQIPRPRLVVVEACSQQPLHG